MKVSLIIPAYNEESIIENTLRSCIDFFDSLGTSWEVIVVNDGSRDRTADIVRCFKNIILISYTPNRGKGYAVKRGMLRATGDYIFFTDADLSYSLDNILRAIKLFENPDLCGVVGMRYDRSHSYPFLRNLGSHFFKGLIRKALHISLSDPQCGFKSFTKQAARSLFSQSKIYDFGFDMEILQLAQLGGFFFAELPVTFVHRKNSKVRLSDSLRMLRDIILLKKRKI